MLVLHVEENVDHVHIHFEGLIALVILGTLGLGKGCGHGGAEYQIEGEDSSDWL